MGGNKINKILVTGAAGYIGSVLVGQLLRMDYIVRGLDILNFGGESILGFLGHNNFEFIKGDIRKKSDIEKSIEGIDAVIHLAAIVGDPACAKQQTLAEETNWTASKYLYDVCQSYNKVKRFIFTSTCSNYGKMKEEEYVNENSPLRPISFYARLKVKFEEYILKNKTSNSFFPTSLRFSTIYGLSPRMRFDLTVNEFVRDLACGREIEIYGEKFWRPYCHIEDIANSIIKVLESPSDKIDHNVFNVGDTNENYQKRMIADEIMKIIPFAKIKYVYKSEDPRDYKVEFSKISKVLGFRITKTLSIGIREINSSINSGLFLNPYSSKYKNI